jgi:hypothetical protein
VVDSVFARNDSSNKWNTQGDSNADIRFERVRTVDNDSPGFRENCDTGDTFVVRFNNCISETDQDFGFRLGGSADYKIGPDGIWIYGIDSVNSTRAVYAVDEAVIEADDALGASTATIEVYGVSGDGLFNASAAADPDPDGIQLNYHDVSDPFDNFDGTMDSVSTTDVGSVKPQPSAIPTESDVGFLAGTSNGSGGSNGGNGNLQTTAGNLQTAAGNVQT